MASTFPVCSLRASKTDGCKKPPNTARKPLPGPHLMEPVAGPDPMKMTVNIWASAQEPGTGMLSSRSEVQAQLLKSMKMRSQESS